MEHATVKIDTYVIPLIGVPAVATTDKCDRCRKKCSIFELMLDPGGKSFYCPDCYPNRNEI